MIIDSKSEGYKQLSRDYNQVLINTENDSLLNDDLKRAFSVYLSKYKNDILIEDYCENFYRSKKDPSITYLDLDNFEYKFLGTLVINNDSIYYGHVELRSTFRRNLIATLDIDPHEVDFIIEQLLESDENGFKSFIKLTGISSKKIRLYPLWSFKSLSTNNSAFFLLHDVLKLLPGILGLDPDYLTKDWIAFGYKIPLTINVKKPTAFDAELNVYWRPGGFTLNLVKTPSKKVIKGLEELISLPIFYANINSRLIRI